MQAMIKKQGNSRGITIPQSVLTELGWKEGTAVDLRIQGGALIAHPLAPSLETLLATVPTGYREPEEDWGADVGKEAAE